MKITGSEWKHNLVQMVFENYEQFKKLYAVFMAMENILSKQKFRKTCFAGFISSPYGQDWCFINFTDSQFQIMQQQSLYPMYPNLHIYVGQIIQFQGNQEKTLLSISAHIQAFQNELSVFLQRLNALHFQVQADPPFYRPTVFHAVS